MALDFSGLLQAITGGGSGQPADSGSTNQTLAAIADQLKRRQQVLAQQRQAAAATDYFSGQRNQGMSADLGSYEPAQQGGLYRTVQKRGRNWNAIGDRLIGGVGAYMAGKRANQLQADQQGEDDSSILAAVQQMTGGDGSKPTDEALRAYVGMLGGKNVQGILGTKPRVQSTKVTTDGKVYAVMSDGTTIDTGLTGDYSSQAEQDANGNWYLIGKNGAGRGIASPVEKAMANAVGLPTQSDVDPNAPQSRWDLHTKQMSAESGGDPNAVSPKGAQGLMQIMPGTAADLEAQMGIPAGTLAANPKLNEIAGFYYQNQLLDKYKGDATLAAMAYNWGMGNVDKWLASGADPNKVPKETRDYAAKVTAANAVNPAGAGAPVQPPAGAAGASAGRQPLRGITPSERAYATAAGKARGEADNAAAIANVAGATTLANEQAKNTATAQSNLGSVTQTTNAAIAAVDDLLKDDSYREIVGSRLAARFNDKIADAGIRLLDPGSKTANAWAKYKHLQGANFLNAFQQLKGGGQITEKEGEKAEQAFARLDRAQSPREYRESLENLKLIMQEVQTNARRKAGGGVPGAASAQSDDDLINKYL